MGTGGLLSASSGGSPPVSGPRQPLEIYRSAPMSLLQLYIPSEAAQTTIAELGGLGLVQFRDVSSIGRGRCLTCLVCLCWDEQLNADVPVHQRTFTADLVRLGEMERKISKFVCVE